MYTQCPDCATVFRLTADALRAAQGEVRCGVCSTSFNALENLSEEAFRAADDEAAPPAPDDAITVEEDPAVEDIELSSANEVAAPDDDDESLEFHGDAADLDRLFVVESPTGVDFDPATVAASLSVGHGAPASDEDGAAAKPPVDLERTDEFPILVLDERDELPEPAAPAPAGRLQAKPAYGPPRILIPEEMRQRLAQEAAAHAASSFDFDGEEGGGDRRRWLWAAAIALLALGFAAQIVHSERDVLVRQPGIGPLLAGTYGLIGRPIDAPRDASAFELRQWGAASDPVQPGRLLLRASIVNRAPYAQPYPILRLALQDRFGSTVGALDVQPADYLPGGPPGALLASGARADAEIRIVDPGEQAVGFEMDVCLREGPGVRCASQVPNPAS